MQEPTNLTPYPRLATTGSLSYALPIFLVLGLLLAVMNVSFTTSPSSSLYWSDFNIQDPVKGDFHYYFNLQGISACMNSDCESFSYNDFIDVTNSPKDKAMNDVFKQCQTTGNTVLGLLITGIILIAAPLVLSYFFIMGISTGQGIQWAIYLSTWSAKLCGWSSLWIWSSNCNDQLNGLESKNLEITLSNSLGNDLWLLVGTEIVLLIAVIIKRILGRRVIVPAAATSALGPVVTDESYRQM